MKNQFAKIVAVLMVIAMAVSCFGLCVSAAEEDVVLLGDVNLNGEVTISDATLIQKALAKLATLDEVQTVAADATEDGDVNIKDTTMIQKWLAKFEDANQNIGQPIDFGGSSDDETTPDETTPDETTPDESTTDEATKDEATTDEATEDEATTDEATKDEATTDEPTEDPTEPSEPVEDPSEPVEDPSEPVEDPSEPVEDPSEPVEDPSEPVEDPSEPATEDESTKDEATTDEATTDEATKDEATADEVAYYLVGWINGADVYDTTYAIVNGTITVELNQDSYVAVQDENGTIFWTDGWLDFNPTSAVLGDYANNDKFHVAAGTVTFTWDAATCTLTRV